MKNTHSDDQRAQRDRQPGLRWIPWAVLIIALGATIGAARYVSDSSGGRERIRFGNAVRSVELELDNRLATYAILLRSTAAHFDASNTVSRADFRDFVDRLGIRSRPAGIRRIGYLAVIPPGKLDSIRSGAQRSGIPDFRIRTEHGEMPRSAVLYVEPSNMDEKSYVGFDMYSDSVRARAMQQAADSGRAVATGRTMLLGVDSTGSHAGFMIFYPVYSGKSVPTTVEERRRNLQGFIFSPFHTSAILAGILDGSPRTIDARIYAGPAVDPRFLVADTREQVPEAAQRRRHRFTSVESVSVLGSNWIIEFLAGPAFEVGARRDLVPFVIVGGLLVTLVLFALTRSQFTARLAVEATNIELERSEAALRSSEARLRRLVDANIVGVFFGRVGGRVDEANESFLSMLGYTPEEFSTRGESTGATPPHRNRRHGSRRWPVRSSGTADTNRSRPCSSRSRDDRYRC